MAATLDLDQLRTFVAIVETGSFTKAADIVFKTQSAVSMQMRRLEERIGKPIFARDGRASRLTEEGERLLGYARRMVRLNDETVAAFDETELSGSVRLGTPDDYADRFLPEVLARFARSNPRVEVSVICEQSTELVSPGRGTAISIWRSSPIAARPMSMSSGRSRCSGSPRTSTAPKSRTCCRWPCSSRRACGVPPLSTR